MQNTKNYQKIFTKDLICLRHEQHKTRFLSPILLYNFFLIWFWINFNTKKNKTNSIDQKFIRPRAKKNKNPQSDLN